MSGESFSQSGHASLVPWVPVQQLEKYDMARAQYSAGFLHCRPERWFPGFAAFWLPLVHALGVEAQLVEIKPLLVVPRSLEYCYCATIGDEKIAIGVDQESARVISESIAPGATQVVSRLMVEYILRRYLSTAAVAWSGEESSQVKFHGSAESYSPDHVGSLKITVMVNNSYCTIWAVLGTELVSRLDGLWKRQLNVQARADSNVEQIGIEIGQIGVNPTQIASFVRRGAVIDLEIPVSDQVTLVMDGKPWMMGRLGLVNDSFAVESLSGAPVQPTLPHGVTRVSVTIGQLTLSQQAISELAQPGTILQSSISSGNQVSLMVQQEQIAEGAICIFDGRFAVQVS